MEFIQTNSYLLDIEVNYEIVEFKDGRDYERHSVEINN